MVSQSVSPIPVGYYECLNCGHAWAGRVSDQPGCARCGATKPAGPVGIGRLRRRVALARLDLQAGVGTDAEAAQAAELLVRALAVSEVALRTARQVMALVEADLRRGYHSDSVLARLGLALWIFSELGMTGGSAACGHLIGLVYAERSERLEKIGSPADLSDPFSALRWFEEMSSAPFLALSHAQLGLQAGTARPGPALTPRDYVAVMSVASFHLAEARRQYFELGQPDMLQGLDHALESAHEQMEACLHGWGREPGAVLQAAGLAADGRLRRESVLEHGRQVSEGLRNEVAGAQSNGGMLGLAAMDQQMRHSFAEAGSRLGEDLAQMGLAAGPELLGGGFVRRGLLEGGLHALGPSIAGAVIDGAPSLAGTDKGPSTVVVLGRNGLGSTVQQSHGADAGHHELVGGIHGAGPGDGMGTQ